MKSRSVLIVGFGDLGLRVSERLLPLGAKIEAVCRSVDKLPSAIRGHEGDYTASGSLALCAELKPDYVLATFTPSDRTEQGYRKGFELAMDNLLLGLGAHRPRCILMASSTRVYAEREGGWVDERSELASTDPLARAIIAAERQLLASGHNASIVRFAGIYGQMPGRLITRIRRGEVSPREPVRYTNRIHREDCAGFITHLFAMAERDETLEPVYTGVDNCPATRHEVESWLADQMGITPAPAAVEKNQDAGMTSHKRCRNTALSATGYELQYVNYQSGYSAMLELPR